jgi:hypothetical protein
MQSYAPSVELMMTNYEPKKYEISAEWNRRKKHEFLDACDAKLFKSKRDVKCVFEVIRREIHHVECFSAVIFQNGVAVTAVV